MKELRKSSEARTVNTYIDLRYGCGSCGCMSTCAPETSSWYPREAHNQESWTLTGHYAANPTG